MPLNAADFVRLIDAGARGVRKIDPQAVIISGAPAVTGINDGIVAIDDRVISAHMLESGCGRLWMLLVFTRTVGPIHRTAVLANPAPAFLSHNDHPSFFFEDTFADYTSAA